MNIEHWHGPQWVLLTAWAFLTFTPLAAYFAGLSKKSDSEFFGERFIEFASRMSIFVVLWWGGFWS